MKFDDIESFIQLPISFTDELMGILSDYKMTFKESSEERLTALKTYYDRTEANDSIKYSLIKKIKEPEKKIDRVSIAFFIYSQTVFERYITKLMKLSIRLSDDLWDRYLDDIYECDTENRDDRNYPKIRDKKWDYLTMEQKKEFALGRFPEVFGKTSNYIINASSYCGIDLTKRSLHWDENNNLTKFLIYDFSEISQRRNLLVHRGMNFDERYLSALDYDLKKRYQNKGGVNYSHKDKQIKKRKIDHAKWGFYKTKNKELIGESALFAPGYIEHTIRVQILILMKFWSKLKLEIKEQNFNEKNLLIEYNKDKKPKDKQKIGYIRKKITDFKTSDNEITEILHKSLLVSTKSGIGPLQIADQIFKQYISENILEENYLKKDDAEIEEICEKVGTYSAVNYLLIRSEIRKIYIRNNKKVIKLYQSQKKHHDRIDEAKNNIAKIKKGRSALERVLEGYILVQEDPMFKVAIKLIHGRKKDALTELSKCKGYNEDQLLEWFMFKEIKNDSKYKKEFRRSLKKACSR